MSIAPSKTLRTLIAHISLRWVLAVLAVLPTVSTIAFIEYLSYRDRQQAIDALADQVLTETNERITQELQTHLQAPLLINRLNHDAVHQGEFDLQNIPVLESILSNRLQQFEQVTAVLFTSSTGIFRAAKRPSNLQLASTTQPPSNNGLVSLLDRPHRSAKPVEIVRNGDIQRDRLWYERALTSIEVGWNPIVHDAANHPILTASQPVYDSATGQLLGIFSAQLQLSYLNELLRRLDLSCSCRVLITDQLGNIISTSTPEPSYPIVTEAESNKSLPPFKLDQSQDALTRSLGQQLLSTPTILTSSAPHQQLKFEHNRELHYVEIRPLIDSYGLNWRVLAVIPKSQLMRAIKINQHTPVILSFLTIGLTTLLGVFAAKGYAAHFAPFASTPATSSDNLAQRQTNGGSTDQVRSLSHTLHQMANQIHQCVNQIQLVLAEAPAIQQTMRERFVAGRVTHPHCDRTFTPREDLFRRAFEHAPVGILLISPTGQILSANTHYCDLLGYAANELLGLPIQDITHPGDRKLVLEGLQQMLAGTVDAFQIEKHYVTKLGTAIPVLLQAAPVRDQDGYVLCFIGHIQDIRDRLKVERQKDEFISTISHELRTPLTSIRGALGVLGTGIYHNRPDKAERMLHIALSNSERLVRLVNDILDFERLSSGKVKLVMQPCQVTDLMQQAIDSVQAIADQSSIRLSLTSIATTVSASPDLIIQTLTNLLSNAIKFSCPGSQIWLKAEVYGDERSRQGINNYIPDSSNASHRATYIGTPCVLFSVKDQGRGIPEDKHETIFEQFQQVDSSDAYKKGGTGLGLAICRKIVQQHNGRIWVESRLGQGSTFYFTLPLVKVNNV